MQASDPVIDDKSPALTLSLSSLSLGKIDLRIMSFACRERHLS